MEPTVGRIVHYRDPVGDDCHAAVVTAVEDGPDGDLVVSLTVFGPGRNPYPLPGVRGGGLSGQWHWPERGDQ